MNTSDIIIIGAGPGGYETAVYAAKQGMSVTIFEGEHLGGTCLNEGCIPTKCLCKNAALLEDLKEGERWGLHDLSYVFDLKKAMQRKAETVQTLTAGIEFLLKNKLITVIPEFASFKDDHTVVTPTGEEYTASAIIIATGSESKLLPIPGIDLPGVITSKEILDITEVPEELCIIGAGVIGLEFASIFQSFGSRVTVVEFAKEILPNFDTDISKRLKQSLVKRGIQIINQAGVSAIEANDGRLTVRYRVKETEQECCADTVLVAVGRAPYLESLNLEQTGIQFSPKGIVTDEHFETSVAGVFAIGDVNGKCMLAHAATFQGKKVIHHLQGKTDGIRLDIIPSAVFTQPEAAAVGRTEEECKQQGITYSCKKAFFRSNGKAICMGEPDGLCKLIVDGDRKLIGCHLFGAHAADLVQEIGALIAAGVTIDRMKEMIHAHPTLSEVLQECAHEF